MELHISQNKRSRSIEKCIIMIINAYKLASYINHIHKNIYHILKKVTLDVGLLHYLTRLSVTFDKYILCYKCYFISKPEVGLVFNHFLRPNYSFNLEIIYTCIWKQWRKCLVKFYSIFRQEGDFLFLAAVIIFYVSVLQLIKFGPRQANITTG